MSAADTTNLATPALREQFPSLSRVIDGRPAVYLDGPAGAQVPGVVIEAMTRYLRRSNSGLEGVFTTSMETDAVYADARRAGADFTGSDPDEIAFGPNMTTLNFLLTRAVARTLSPGDEIVTTALEHDGNVSPWLNVAQDFGLVVRTVPFREDTTLDLDALEGLLGERTKVVAFTLASNAFGTKTDAKRIAAMAHGVGALAWGDAVHFAPHARIDRRALGLDVVLCSPYKFFGPHLGMAAIERRLAEELPADRVRPAGETPAGHRFETGTGAHEAVAGFTPTVDYLAGLGEGATRGERLDSAYARIVDHEQQLTVQALRRFADVPGLRLYGIGDPERAGERTPTFSFTIDGLSPETVCRRLNDEAIFAWNGNFYALNAALALDVEGSGGFVRVGFLHYTTPDEVDRLGDALESIARRR